MQRRAEEAEGEKIGVRGENMAGQVRGKRVEKVEER